MKKDNASDKPAIKPAGRVNEPRAPKKKSNKGALIKGMSKRLPVELLDEPSFKDGLQQIMRNYAGVYALYRKNRLDYVGLATRNLYGRILVHTRNRNKGKWDRFAIFRVNRRYVKDIETLLLQVADPPANVVTGHLHRDADLTRVLRRIQIEQLRRMKRIKKAMGK
jgi:hypothetical protein